MLEVLLYLISSNISGFSRSLCFILSFIAVMIVFALSSAPCFELFSAAPTNKKIPCLLSILCNTRGRREFVKPLLINNWENSEICKFNIFA